MKLTVQYILVVYLLCFGSHLYSSGFDLSTKIVDLSGDITAKNINVIYNDSAGYLWLGTNTGLFRWDGFKAIHFKNNTDSENVTTIKQAPNGTIWIGYHDGSIAFAEKRSLISFQADQYLNDSASVSDILFDSKGGIWWSTYGSGLYCYSNNKLAKLNTSNGLNDNYIYDLEYGANNQIWVATDNGINICNADSLTNTLVAKNFSIKLPDLIVLKLIRDHDGFIWLGFHQGGVYYFNPNDSTLNEIENPDGKSFGQINALTLEKKDVWILDEKNGLFYSEHPHKNNLKPIRFKGQVLNKGMKSVITDSHGNLWILTKKQLYVSNGPGIIVAESFVEKELHSIVSAGVQDYWLSTNSNIIKMDKDGTHFFLERRLNYSSPFTSMVMDHNDNLWAGTLGQGIIVYNPHDSSHRVVDKTHGLINNNVLSIAYRNGIIWAATLGGSSAITINDESQLQNIRSFDKEHGLSTNFIYTIFPDSKGRIWFGTDGNGLLKLENNVFYTYDENQGVSDKIIYSIVEDPSGNIWFSTSNSVLYKYDGNRFEKINPGEGFSGRFIYSLATEGDLLFILTDEGLNIYNYKSRIYVCLNEELKLGQIVSDLNSVCTNKKSICFATHNKIIHIDRELINYYSIQPNTSLDWITVNLEPISHESRKSFIASDNRFVFEYSGSWPLAPNKIQYMVKLDGYDPEWKNTYDRTATYPNLLPGNYTFKVKAILHKTELIEEVTSFSFIIQKPFYSSIWFIILIVILLFAVIFWFVKFRENRLKLTEARKKEKLEFEFQTLKNQVNPHFLFNSFSTLISIIEDKPEEAVAYTEALSGFFRDILEVKEEPLILLTEELRMMRNYSLIHQKRMGDNFMVDIQLDESVETSKIPPLTLQLLAENALKHNIIAKGKPIIVTISNNKKTIIVQNNKRLKKNTEQSTGIGLRNISERYKLISGTDIIVEETTKTFRVIIPIIK